MSDVHDQLVRAILDGDPDDDGPRLVYADHLQSIGDPRGELIAMQCAEARLGGDVLEHRSLALLDDHAARWLGAWHREPGSWRFRRGFLHHLAVPLDTFAVIAEALFEQRAQPDELIHVEELVLQQPRTGETFEQLRWKRSIPGTSLTRDYGLCEVHASSAARSIARLRLGELSLQLMISTAFARALAELGFAHLRSLAVDSPFVEHGAVPALMQGLRQPLVALQLRCDLVHDDWETIARSPCGGGLRRLAITADRAASILMIAANPALTSLEVRGVGPGEPTVLDVLGEFRPPLVALDVGGDEVDCTPLANLRTLERLDLSRSGVNDAALDAIFQLPRLTTLNVAHTAISVDGLERIVAEAPPSLRELTIGMPRILTGGTRVYGPWRGFGTNAALPPGLLERLHARFVLHRWH